MKLDFKISLLCCVMTLSLLFTSCGVTDNKDAEADSFIEDTQDVTLMETDKEVVGVPPEEDTETEESTEENTESEELSEEEKEWQNYLMADVELSLRIRKEPNADADVLGVLEKGDRATVIEKGPQWTKVSSGEVVGYVSNEFCLYGTDALEHAKSVCKTIATSITDQLCIRQMMNTESECLGTLEKGKNLEVDTQADTEEGWIAVLYNGTKAYVSSEYVIVGLDVGNAITIEELYIREKELAQTQNPVADTNTSIGGATGSTSTGSTSTGIQTTINTACIVNASEYEILAAMIWCESGNQTYECNLAVASVIMNRVRSKIFPNTIKEVVFQEGQFPPAAGGVLEYCLKNGKTTENCYKAAQAAMDGQDNTDGCLYFNTYKGTQEGLRIGAMVFWKTWK